MLQLIACLSNQISLNEFFFNAKLEFTWLQKIGIDTKSITFLQYNLHSTHYYTHIPPSNKECGMSVTKDSLIDPASVNIFSKKKKQIGEID